MPKTPKITEEDIVSRINGEIDTADGQGQSTLSEQRKEADLAYAGQTTQGMGATTNMSSIIMNVMQPAVDTLTTYLTKVTCSDRETVVFAPTDEDMFENANLITDRVNNVIYKDNSGYKVINRWIKDSLLHKTGIVKVVWNDTPESHKEVFEGSEQDYNVWVSKKEEEGYEVEILEEETTIDTMTISSEETNEVLEVSTNLTTYLCKVTKEKGVVELINIPPEEFIINEGATSINDDSLTRFVAHRQIAYKSDILEMFPDVDPDLLQPSSELNNENEKDNRHAFDGTANENQGSSTDGALDQVEIVESWIKMSMDVDGNNAEWYHVFTSGHNLLMHEEWYGPIPMCSFTPFPIPHKFYGLGLWDKIRDYHKTKTALVRSTVDYAVQVNTIRIIADPRKISTRDLKSGRTGIIKAKPGFEPKDVLPLNVGSGNPGSATAMLQYLDKEIIGQIGIDVVTGMVSTDIEKSGNDAEKTSMSIDNASVKVEMMTREFAETGLRDMIWAIADLLVQHGEFPHGLSKSDLIAKVGLGFQTDKQKLDGANAIIAQQNLLESNPTNPVPVPAEFKLAASNELAKSLGYEDTSKFFPKTEEVEAERARVAKAAEAQQAQAMQLQQIQVQQQSALNETTMLLNQAKAEKASVEAQAAERNQQLKEETEVVAIDNVKEDNARNDRQIDAIEEQMVAKIDLDKDKLSLEIAKADDESERPTDVTHK